MTSTGGFFRKWGLALVMIAAIIGCVWIGVRRRMAWKKAHIFVELKAIQTPVGWGYDILTNGHPYIHQGFIPDISGNHGFRTKEEALAVGQKVKDRLMANQLPAISIEEMRQMNVQLPDDTTNLKK
jgi:hypothetical protein